MAETIGVEEAEGNAIVGEVLFGLVKEIEDREKYLSYSSADCATSDNNLLFFT